MEVVDHVRRSEELKRAISALVVYRRCPITTLIFLDFDRGARARPHVVVVIRDTEIIPTDVVVNMLNEIKCQRVSLQTGYARWASPKAVEMRLTPLTFPGVTRGSTLLEIMVLPCMRQEALTAEGVKERKV
jgi:hypothetical protein